MFNVPITGEFIAFLILSFIIICGAVLIVSLNKLAHVTAAMAAVFAGTAGLFALLEAGVLAFVQVLVFTGALTILMLAGIRLTRQQEAAGEAGQPLQELFAAAGTFTLFGLLFYAIRRSSFDQQGLEAPDNLISWVGEQLVTNYLLHAVLVLFLFATAIIGAVVIVKKEAD